MLSRGVTAETLSAIEHEVSAIIEDAVQFAQDSPYPALDEVFEDVYEKTF
jgi:pyruvate dehydrogenase E1 component alpha subunit